MKKKLFYSVLCVLTLVLSGCRYDKYEEYETYSAIVELSYPEGGKLSPAEGVKVTLYSSGSSSTFSSLTDAQGKAEFTVPAGIYEASATDKHSIEGTAYILNGLKSDLVITARKNESPILLNLVESTVNQIVIKELYIGGCQKNDGSGAFVYDKYVILYNNSDQTASLDKICFAMITPLNSNNANDDYINNVLFYEAEGWIPAGYAVWYFNTPASLEPGKQIVIAMTNALDNTSIYSNSINFSNGEYYCFYDVSGTYTNVTHYPVPDAAIPVSHHLKVHTFGVGNAWPLSVNSPAFFIFSSEGIDLADFINDESTTNYYKNSISDAFRRKKIPVELIRDGVEVFKADATNYKRLTAAIDAGSVKHTNNQGYTLYRNVDQEETEAIEENAGKLVYNYSLGTEDITGGTTDPSGIDAEASAGNGARIIYKDTNNSTNDFHQRSRASLRD